MKSDEKNNGGIFLKNFTLRVEDELLEKFHYICKFQRRSANQQLLMMIEHRVKLFEQRYGPITLELRQTMYREGK